MSKIRDNGEVYENLDKNKRYLIIELIKGICQKIKNRKLKLRWLGIVIYMIFSRQEQLHSLTRFEKIFNIFKTLKCKRIF